MSTVIGRLNTDHANMLRLLDILDRELDVIEKAGNANLELMRDVMHYLVRYSDAIHHPMEDLVYARLADYSPRARTDLIRIPEQHEQIAADSRQLHDAISGIVDGGMVRRTAILASGRDYVSNQRRHIEMEERHLFPLVQATLDDQDLDEVLRIFNENQDPVFGEVVAEDFRVLYRHIQDRGG